MSDRTGQIVLATAGRDRGGLFCVVGEDREFLLLADGKRRRVSHPKRKKPGHVTAAGPAEFDHPVIRKLKQGEPVSDRALRQALATFKGGDHTWQKTI